MPKKHDDAPKGGRGSGRGPQPTATPVGDGNPPNQVTKDCNSGTALSSSIDNPSNVTVKVRNNGRCDVEVRLFTGNTQRGSTFVSAGKQETISSSSITRADIDCKGSADTGGCRFTYSILWT